MVVIFNDMVGQTVQEITGGVQYSDELIFIMVNGDIHKFYHEQECCENVAIEDINGDLSDLIGKPLTVAELVSSSSEDTGYYSQTWTFYKFSTNNGCVTIRWLGESSGAYSETVDYKLIKEK